jgi:hypothetical protein
VTAGVTAGGGVGAGAGAGAGGGGRGWGSAGWAAAVAVASVRERRVSRVFEVFIWTVLVALVKPHWRIRP